MKSPSEREGPTVSLFDIRPLSQHSRRMCPRAAPAARFEGPGRHICGPFGQLPPRRDPPEAPTPRCAGTRDRPQQGTFKVTARLHRGLAAPSPPALRYRRTGRPGASPGDEFSQSRNSRRSPRGGHPYVGASRTHPSAPVCPFPGRRPCHLPTSARLVRITVGVKSPGRGARPDGNSDRGPAGRLKPDQSRTRYSSVTERVSKESHNRPGVGQR
jgi:hypothetical protein